MNVSKRSRIVPSDLELIVAGILDDLGIEYEPEYPTRTGFIIDFALLDKKIALEVDGPHHDTSQRKKSDRFRDYQLKREGWITKRIHHSEFDGNIERLIKSLI